MLQQTHCHIPQKICVAVDHCISRISRQMYHVKLCSVASHTHTDLLFFFCEMKKENAIYG